MFNIYIPISIYLSISLSLYIYIYIYIHMYIHRLLDDCTSTPEAKRGELPEEVQLLFDKAKALAKNNTNTIITHDSNTINTDV